LAQGQFESGLATKVLNDLADYFPYLDAEGKGKRFTAHSDLLQKFTELAFDEAFSLAKGEDEKEISTMTTVWHPPLRAPVPG
jgi:hypothetical protein